MIDIDNYTNTRVNSNNISFYTVLREATPNFIFEDLLPYKSNKISSFYKHIAFYLDIIYDKIKNISGELTVNDNSGQYLYELAYEIGLNNVAELSKYLNSDGTVNTSLITESQYESLINNEKVRLKASLANYLSKGTIDSIKSVFSLFNSTIEITEFWKTDSSEVFDVSGWEIGDSVFDANVYSVTGGLPDKSFLLSNNSLITKYGDSIISNQVYEYTNIDIKSEIIASCPELSGGNLLITDFQCNYKNYYYLLTNSLINGISGNYLYFKTNEEPENNTFNSNTWYRFSGIHETSGTTVEEIKLTDNYIFIRYNNSQQVPTNSGFNLDVYDNTLETNNLLFSIDNNNCYFFQPITELNLLIIDKGNIIEIRELDNFYPKFKLDKPTPYFIKYLLNCDSNNYLAINENHECYLLKNLSLREPDISTTTVPTIPIGNKIICAYEVKKNLLVIFSNTGTNINKCIINTSDLNNLYTNDSTFLSVSGMQLLDSQKFYEKIILLTNTNKLYYYDTNTSTYSQSSALDVGIGFSNIFLADKLYLYRKLSPNTLQKIIGYNIGINFIYKLHYFDAIVNLNSISNVFLKSDEDIIELINLLKPLHTKLNNLTVYNNNGYFGFGTFGLGDFGIGG